ncbi:hypothetical protein ACFRJ8_15165 [Arthrobacter sp. NPDC056886]|uniref:hypothetical protein n=1 Tax=Arthrobacter sp. NPDC056886 TaxID=3345960 RepID=UPI003670665A
MNDSTMMVACAVINAMEHEGRSALPDAPIVAAPSPGRRARRLAAQQRWLASVTYRAAEKVGLTRRLHVSASHVWMIVQLRK